MKKKSVNSSYQLSAANKARLLNAIQNNKHLLAAKKVTAGFDGFVDTIIKVIKKKPAKKSPVFFSTIKEFGQYVTEKEGASFSLETAEQHSKLGGNMPIMANALGQLGTHVNCIGALGYPQVHQIFKNLSPLCKLHSFANPGTASAYEFTDGKIMLAQITELHATGWEKIKEITGIDTLINIYGESNLICLLNWSEIDASTDIWKGVLKDVLPACSGGGQKQIAFFDLSDCSGRSSQAIIEAMELLQAFAKQATVVLSLNKNEARIIYKSLFNKSTKKDLASIGKKIFEQLSIATLILHSSREAIAFTNDEYVNVESFFTGEPKISTGAGDNFNAGFCTGQLLQLDLESSLILANAVSGYYVRNAISPQLSDIIEFLKNLPSPD